jgi:Family of unknown function (DUF6481)
VISKLIRAHLSDFADRVSPPIYYAIGATASFFTKESMFSSQDIGHTQRQKTASEAKAALLAKFKPREASVDPRFEERAALRAAELTQIRQDRAEAKASHRQAVADAAQALVDTADALAADALAAKRGERKERKALSAAEAKAKRDARYAARKAR